VGVRRDQQAGRIRVEHELADHNVGTDHEPGEKKDKAGLEALDERILERAVEKAAGRVAQRRVAAPDRRAHLERELAEVEARLQRGLDALPPGAEAADELRSA
jgi:hypothetical protein